MSEVTVQVPVKWLEKLLKISRKATVSAYSTGLGVRLDDQELTRLKGYIESAESLLATTSPKGKE